MIINSHVTLYRLIYNNNYADSGILLCFVLVQYFSLITGFKLLCDQFFKIEL